MLKQNNTIVISNSEDDCQKDYFSKIQKMQRELADERHKVEHE